MSGKKHILKNKQIAFFCQQIAMVVKAGLPIYYGISILRDEADDEKTKEFFSKIYIPMEKGASLYDSIKDTGYFPKYMIRMIRLGEETGRMEEVLTSLTSYYQREADIHAAIQHVVFYPLVLILMLLAVITVIMTQVVPIFAKVYESVDAQMSHFAQTLLQISDFMNAYLIWFILAFIILLAACIILYQTPLGKTLFQGRKLSMSIAASRFANCMHMVLASGLDTDKGLEISAELVDNPYMQERIQKCQSHLKHGEIFGNALLLSGIFSKIYGSLISIGQKTGTMDEVMLRISHSCEEETDMRLRRLISILEPTLIVILSIFVGLILITYLLPLLEILSGIGQ